jgi:hypothetical protein
MSSPSPERGSRSTLSFTSTELLSARPRDLADRW